MTWIPTTKRLPEHMKNVLDVTHWMELPKSPNEYEPNEPCPQCGRNVSHED